MSVAADYAIRMMGARGPAGDGFKIIQKMEGELPLLAEKFRKREGLELPFHAYMHCTVRAEDIEDSVI